MWKNSCYREMLSLKTLIAEINVSAITSRYRRHEKSPALGDLK
jgi:hypothetical protein